MSSHEQPATVTSTAPAIVSQWLVSKYSTGRSSSWNTKTHPSKPTRMMSFVTVRLSFFLSQTDAEVLVKWICWRRRSSTAAFRCMTGLAMCMSFDKGSDACVRFNDVLSEMARYPRAFLLVKRPEFSRCFATIEMRTSAREVALILPLRLCGGCQRRSRSRIPGPLRTCALRGRALCRSRPTRCRTRRRASRSDR